MDNYNQIYVDSKKNVEEAIKDLEERAKALLYKGNYAWSKEVSDARDSMVVLLGKIEGVHEKYPETLLLTEVTIGNVPKEGRITLVKGEHITITYNLFRHKESFYIYLKDIAYLGLQG